MRSPPRSNDAPDRAALLRQHRAALVAKRGRLDAMKDDELAAPTEAAVQAAVADHRAHITRWFYPCSPQLHRGLGAMYVADPRFTANLDKVAPGFAQFLSEAIAAS